MKKLASFSTCFFILLTMACRPVTYNPGNYYGKKKVVIKEKYTSADERKKKKYYTEPEYKRKQLAKKRKM